MALQKEYQRCVFLAFICCSFILGYVPKAVGQEVFVAYPSVAVANIPFLVAKAQGYYQMEDMSLTMVQMPGATAVRAVMTASVSFTTALGSSIEAIVRGPELKILMVQGDKPLYDLFAHPSIRSITELKGKRVGVGAFGGADDVVTRTMLSKHGLKPGTDVILLQGGPPSLRLTAMMAGSIDASAFPPPLNFMAIEKGFVKLGFAGDYMNSLFGGIITTPKLISSDRELVVKFVRATLKGRLFFAEKREESLNIMSSGLNIKDRKTASQVYDYIRPTLTQDGTISTSLMEAVIEERKHAAGVTRPLDPKGIFDFSIIRQAMSELKTGGWKP